MFETDTIGTLDNNAEKIHIVNYMTFGCVIRFFYSYTTLSSTNIPVINVFQSH